MERCVCVCLEKAVCIAVGGQWQNQQGRYPRVRANALAGHGEAGRLGGTRPSSPRLPTQTTPGPMAEKPYVSVDRRAAFGRGVAVTAEMADESRRGPLTGP